MIKVLVLFAGLILATAGIALLFWFLWLLWKKNTEEVEMPAIEIKVEPVPVAAERTKSAGAPSAPKMAPEPVTSEHDPEAQAEEETPDDLKRIEGVGPKISGVLHAAGIRTFAQLADASESQIERILEEADPRLLRLAKPATWPEQAALAAAGEWDALQALQGEFKGGRRSS